MNVLSTCIYCGVGCRLKYVVDNKKILKVLPDDSDPVSRGKPCIKGLTIHEAVDEGRITSPMINAKGRLKKISWKDAFDIIYKNISKLSPEEVFLSASGKITNEDNYIIQKFGRMVLNTNNIDSCCTRLCHAPTTMALKDNFGIAAAPDYISELPGTDVLLIIGSNPASNYPVNFDRVLEMKKMGGKIITMAPMFSESADYADLHISIFPGTEVAFLNGIMKILIERGINSINDVVGFENLKNVVKKYDIKTVAEICKVKEGVIEEAAEMIATSKKFGVMHGMGLTQHVNGIENVHTLCNLVILKSGKIFSSRGEINVQGVGDVLAVPNLLQFTSSADKLKKTWGCNLSTERGLNLIEALGFGEIKTAFISNFNPAQSMPDLNRIHKNLKKIFLVQMDSYFNYTSRFAKVILPVPLLIERNGTITNGERMIRLVRKVREPPGECLAEWKIFSRFASMFNVKGFDYKDEKEIFREIVKVIDDLNNINPEEVYNGKDVYANKKKAFEKIVPEDFEGIEELSSKKYPFILFTFRSKWQFLTGESTSKSKTLKKLYGQSYFHLNPEDAKKMKIKDNDRIKVSSKVSDLIGYAKVDEKISKGFIGAQLHSDKLLINKLFPLQFDEESFTPNLKTVAVRIKKV